MGPSSARLGGVVPLLLGELPNGIRVDQPVPQLLDLYSPNLPPDGPPTPLQRPDYLFEKSERFFTWWVGRLNNLLGVLLDPTRFSEDGVHDAQAPFPALLNVERLFTTLQGLMAGWHDEFARRLMLCDVLDPLEGIDFASTETLLTPRRARKALARIAESGAGVAAPALDKCEMAVDAPEMSETGSSLASVLAMTDCRSLTSIDAKSPSRGTVHRAAI